MSGKKEIKLSGIGGQGVVLAGTIIGCAASVYDGINAVQTKEYGSELRGGDVSTAVIVSDSKIVFPSVIAPDVLITLAQQAFKANAHFLNRSGITLISDADQVKVPEGSLPEGTLHLSAPFNRIADQEFKSNTVLNMILLGFFAEATGIISADALKNAVSDLVPPNSREMNLRAVELGLEEGRKLKCQS